MTCCKDKTYVEVWLPYFKQGDDLANYLNDCETPTEAMNQHAEMLRQSALQLDNIAALIAGKNSEIYANTHHISLITDNETAKALVEANLAFIPEDMEDECNEECCGQCLNDGHYCV
jgi:hypothetical protein